MLRVWDEPQGPTMVPWHVRWMDCQRGMPPRAVDVITTVVPKLDQPAVGNYIGAPWAFRPPSVDATADDRPPNASESVEENCPKIGQILDRVSEIA